MLLVNKQTITANFSEMATIHLPWPNGSLVEIDGSGLGKIKSSDMSTGDFMYDVEIESS